MSSLAAASMLSLLLAGPVLAQSTSTARSTNEKLGTRRFLDVLQRRTPSRCSIVRSRCSTPSSSARAIEGFNADARGRSVVRDGGVGHRAQPVGQSVRDRPSSARAAPAGARRREPRERRSGRRPRARRAYVEAVSQLFAGFETIDQRTRVLAYRDAMARVAAANPNDTEASIFHALAIAAAAPPTDKTYADLLKAGAMLERIIASQPDHPGLAHYIIHSYDVPPLADRALEAARRYAKIAPSAPHALHMPSHTFTRVGYWQDSIDTNIASGAAAKRDGVDRRRTAHDGLPDVRLSSDGAGRRGAPASSTRCPR